MNLTKFRVKNFRSINDSGDVDVETLTALVGRNESGKSNLLLGLSTLNPPGGRQSLSPIKDFPRWRRLEECTEETVVVASDWRLSDQESKQLGETLKQTEKIETVSIGRRFLGKLCWVGLNNLKPPMLDAKQVGGSIRRLAPILTATIDKLEEPLKGHCKAAWMRVASSANLTGDKEKWAVEITASIKALRAKLGEASIMLDAAQDDMLEDLTDEATNISGFEERYKAARTQVVEWLPTFVYVSDFPELAGHQNLDEFVNHRGQNPSFRERHDNFEKLAKVADFDPAQLQKLQSDHETRNQLLNRAGSLITGEIRRLWKDRSLLVRFNLDGPYLDILVSDPNATYPVEVNLDERSRGFRWFFSFYTTFAADTRGGNADGAIILLDEPGLYLHAKSQDDLLKHLQKDYKNQIIYTTHSPFMVPADAIKIVRTVNITQEFGTQVTNSPTGDSRTLFPLQAALGYSLSQTLFVGNSNIIVEGVTDFWILSSVSEHLISVGRVGLPEKFVLTPVGGAGKVSYMTALLAAQELEVLVLLDDDRAGRETKKDIVTSRLLKETSILFVTDGFDDPKPSEADIEDLIDPTVYESLVRKTYKSELSKKVLSLNPKIPRIVKRFEEALEQIGLEFNKTRPAREFMSRMASDAPSVLTSDSAGKFEQTFKLIGERITKHRAAKG
jgi:AAA ATPase domain